MHEDYKSKNEEQKVVYTSYLRRVNNLNISLALLGLEECETCAVLKLLPDDNLDGQCTATCTTCAKTVEHKTFSEQSRAAYKRDGGEVIPAKVVQKCRLGKSNRSSRKNHPEVSRSRPHVHECRSLSSCCGTANGKKLTFVTLLTLQTVQIKLGQLQLCLPTVI